MGDRPARHHEAPLEREGPTLPSERSFGLVFTAVFAILGLLPWLRGRGAAWWLIAVAGLFAGVTLGAPRLLAPLNRLWFRLGLLLSRVVNPLVVGILFFLVVLPTALFRRMMRRDPLGLSWSEGEKSYWVERKPPGPSPETMKNQF